jgi:hypothetical protein
MARAMYAPGTTTPTSTGFYAEDFLLDPMLLGIDQVSINGQVAWSDLDDNALRAVFQAGGPTGAPLFIATSAPPAANTAPSTGTTTQQTTQPGTTTGTVPQTTTPPQTTQPGTTSTGATGTTGQAPAAAGQYASPQFGYTVAWSGGWTELAEVRQSDTVNGTDTVGIYTGTPGPGAITVVGMASGSWTPQTAMEYWMTPDYLAQKPAGTTVVLSRFDATRGGVVTVGPFANDDPEIWVTVYEATFVNGQVEIDVTFSAPLGSFEAVYANAQQSVLVNGVPAVGLFTIQEIMTAVSM